MINDLKEILAISVNPSDSMSKAINAIDLSGHAACALVFDLAYRFLGFLTGADIRRAFLYGISLDVTVCNIMPKRWRLNGTCV